MNDSPDNSAQGNGFGAQHAATQAECLMESGELHELASHYFADEFQRPDRSDCPDQAVMFSQAQSGSLPDDALRAHLFSCSECFQAYRAALAVRTVPVPSNAWWMNWRNFFTLRPGLVWTGAIALLCAITLLSYTWWRTAIPRLSGSPAEQTISSTASDSKAAVAQIETPPNPLNLPSPPRPSQTPIAEAPEAVATLSLDLNDYVALRDVTTDAASEKAITLAPRLTRLRLRLPEGSAVGGYIVSILDQADSAVVSKTAKSLKKKELIVVIDLRQASERGVQLQIGRIGDIPDYYPIKWISLKSDE